MRQSHKAGEKLFVDFPGGTVPVRDRRTGEVALRAELFVAVMGASNYLYAEAFPSQELLYWVTAHVHCFEALAACVAEINARPFQKLDGSRQLLFEQVDHPALRPLPATRYEFATWHKARVNIDYHIVADKHYYSVPHQLVRQQVEVRLSAATV